MMHIEIKMKSTFNHGIIFFLGMKFSPIAYRNYKFCSRVVEYR